MKGTATGLAANANAAYWCETSFPTQELARWDVATERLESLGEARNCQVLVGDGGDMFLSTSQQIRRIAANGTSSEILFEDPTGFGYWYALAVDESFVYWADFGVSAGSGPTGAIYRGPKVGGASELLEMAPTATAVAVDGDAVYWIWRDGLTKRSKSTGETQTLSIEPRSEWWGSNTIQLEGDFVYWLSHRGIERTPKAGGATVLLMAGINASANKFSIQAGCMYFAVLGSLYRRPLGGGPMVEIATSKYDSSIFSFTTNETGVFWSDWRQENGKKGEVYMLPLTP